MNRIANVIEGILLWACIIASFFIVVIGIPFNAHAHTIAVNAILWADAAYMFILPIYHGVFEREGEKEGNGGIQQGNQA